MAHILPIPKEWLAKNPKAAKLEGFVNLDHPVGPNCPNLADDVKLVQGLIRLWGGKKFAVEQFFVTKQGLRGPSFLAPMDSITTIPFLVTVNTPFEGYLPEANGRCDEVTITWIRMFQMIHQNRLGSAINGRVDPATAGSNLAKPTTIMLLNSMRVTEGFKAMPASYMKPS